MVCRSWLLTLSPWFFALRIVLPTIASFLRLKPIPFLNWSQTPESINITAVSVFWLSLPEPMLPYFCFFFYYLLKTSLCSAFNHSAWVPQILGSIFLQWNSISDQKRSRTSPHLGIADVQAVQNTFLASCVFKKIPKERSVAFPAFWLAHPFALDTYLDCCSSSTPWMSHRSPANINLIQNRKLAILTTLLLSIPLVTTQIKNMTYNESYIYKIKWR